MSAPVPTNLNFRIPIGPGPCTICDFIKRWKCFFVALAALIIVPLILAIFN